MTDLPIGSDRLYDSCVIIDALMGDENAATLIGGDPRRYLSAITRAEVLAGLNMQSDRQIALFMMSRFTTLDVTAHVADCAGNIRRDRKLKLPDACILATAVVHDLALVTRDEALASKFENAVLYKTSR